MTCLIDADIFLWKAAIAAETEINWGSDVWTLYADLAEAKRAFEAQITKVEDEFVKVQVGDSVEMRIQKTSVGATLPKGTIKSLD